jgi:hypothetical protein
MGVEYLPVYPERVDEVWPAGNGKAEGREDEVEPSGRVRRQLTCLLDDSHVHKHDEMPFVVYPDTLIDPFTQRQRNCAWRPHRDVHCIRS